MKTQLLFVISILITTLTFGQSVPFFKIKNLPKVKEKKVIIEDSMTAKNVKTKFDYYETLDDIQMKRFRLKTLNKRQEPIINLLCVN